MLSGNEVQACQEDSAQDARHLNPGISGPLTGSTMTSESRAWPSMAASPFKMPATCRAVGALFKRMHVVLNAKHVA